MDLSLGHFSLHRCVNRDPVPTYGSRISIYKFQIRERHELFFQVGASTVALGFLTFQKACSPQPVPAP